MTTLGLIIVFYLGYHTPDVVMWLWSKYKARAVVVNG